MSLIIFKTLPEGLLPIADANDIETLWKSATEDQKRAGLVHQHFKSASISLVFDHDLSDMANQESITAFQEGLAKTIANRSNSIVISGK